MFNYILLPVISCPKHLQSPWRFHMPQCLQLHSMAFPNMKSKLCHFFSLNCKSSKTGTCPLGSLLTGYNIANKFFSAPFISREGTRNWLLLPVYTGKRMGQEQVKTSWTFLFFLVWPFWIEYSFGCWRSLTDFQNFYKVSLASF